MGVMRSSIAVLALLSLCIGVAACGRSSTDEHGSSATSVAGAPGTPGAPGTTNASTGVVSAPPSLRSLEGDEDDDETGEKLGDSSKDNDADFDNDLKPQPGYNDADDGPVRTWGHAATAAQAKALRGIVERYFAAASSGDGKSACALITPVFVHAIPEDYGQAPGPAYLRGKTCAVVMTKLFEHSHRELAGGIVVTAVRVGGGEALALVGSPTMWARYIVLKRSPTGWGVDGLLGLQMP